MTIFAENIFYLHNKFGDCSITECQPRHPPLISNWQNCKYACKNTTNKEGCSAPGMSSQVSVPLSHSGNVVSELDKNNNKHEGSQGKTVSMRKVSLALQTRRDAQHQV